MEVRIQPEGERTINERIYSARMNDFNYVCFTRGSRGWRFVFTLVDVKKSGESSYRVLHTVRFENFISFASTAKFICQEEDE